MIIGIGNDLCDIRRIERALDRYGDRFKDRVFAPEEKAKAERRHERVRAGTYAKRFAAKEACSKALGTGFSQGVFMIDIAVVNLPSGQPTLRLTNGALERLNAMVPAGHEPRIALTLTDEYPLAEALVIIEAVPKS